MTRQPTATAGRWQKEKAHRDLSSVRSAHRRSAFTRPAPVSFLSRQTGPIVPTGRRGSARHSHRQRDADRPTPIIRPNVVSAAISMQLFCAGQTRCSWAIRVLRRSVRFMGQRQPQHTTYGASISNNDILTSPAVLSTRKPVNAGCLRLSPVNSLYSTSHTKSGSAQRASRAIARGGATATDSWGVRSR
jgi:hypothetical protein